MTAVDPISPARIPVVIVQRHRVLRDAVHRWLASEPTLDVVGAEPSVGMASSLLAHEPAAVVVVDEPAAGQSAGGIMLELRAASSTARAVMLVGAPDVATVSAAINAGVAAVQCRGTDIAGWPVALASGANGE
ncbi:MAG: response regulator transcription factor [Actinobacteria bacterium]|nr:response regulator transcription factor [Actinomycetota bacterium]